jgi:thiosulfate/3-mercaptopyruvate sulfurtransferase
MTAPLSFFLLVIPFVSGVQSDLLISTDTLAENLHDPSLVIVHVSKGSRKTYDEGHIPGARLLGWDDFVRTRDGIPNEVPEMATLEQAIRKLGITEQSRIVLYDEATGIQASRAYFTFDTIGLGDRTSLLDGNLAKWRAEGRELSQAPVEPVPSNIVLQPNPNTLVTKDQLSQLLQSPDSATTPLVDSRKPSQYTGEEGAGHLPGAVNVYVGDQLTEDEIPILRPIRELLDQYEAKGIPPGKEVITYCNTGQSASQAYFILKYLGYQPKLYDGSMSEWSADPAAPVVKGATP